jgi:hypothetical protein
LQFAALHLQFFHASRFAVLCVNETLGRWALQKKRGFGGKQQFFNQSESYA